MELTPELIKNLSREQLELLTELGELAAKEASITEQIELNRRQAEKAGIGREREVATRLMDDQEYDNLVSVQLIYEREQVRGKVQSVLKSLISNGLDNLDLIRRQAPNYGVELD